jgi:4-hydroxybenzoate polyprenyltransferase
MPVGDDEQLPRAAPRRSVNTELTPDPVSDHATAPAGPVRLRDLVQLLRPHQWVKNVVVFAAPAAGQKLFELDGIIQSLIAFASFCLVASAVYAINDTMDRHADALHPTKRFRPVARGAIKPAVAVLMALGLFLGGLLLTAFLLNPGVIRILVAYFILLLGYSLGLKRRVILDVILIATGFVLRAGAGAAAVGVPTSEWLVACVFTLCLFLGFGKRRCEVAALGNAEDARQHRVTLVRYTPELLSHLTTVSAGIAIITFLLYTMDSRIAAPFHKEYLFYTLPLVVYGVFRFAMLTQLGIHAGPTEIILQDRMLQVAIVVWALAALGIAYLEVWGSWFGLTVPPIVAPAAANGVPAGLLAPLPVPL